MCLGAQKNRLIETALLSTNNMIWLRNKKIMFIYTLLSGGLMMMMMGLSLSARNKLQRKEKHMQTKYSKTCVNRPLKKRQNKDLNDKW